MHSRIPLKNSVCIIMALLIILVACSSKQAPVISDEGHNFIADARLLYRVVVCGDGEIPASVDRTMVDDHCVKFKKNFEIFRGDYLAKAAPFMAGIRPRNLPNKVLYPFGGGDLLAALFTYPDAVEYTTISLENSGDPRRIAKAKPAELRWALAHSRDMLGFLLCQRDNSYVSVRALERGLIPNQLAFSLTAIAAMDFEPVSLKYFTINPDGSLHYLTLEEIAKVESTKARKLDPWWIDCDFSVAFRNMELAFRKRGGGPDAPIIVHRHIAANLHNSHFTGSPLHKHLLAKGKVSMMTKGASYLPWMDGFSAFRDYMLGAAAFMISDATGVLPRHAKKAGFEQITYGKFTGAFLKNNGGADAAEFRALWKSQPFRPLSFRFGFSDIYGASHLVITRPLTVDSEKGKDGK